jgi:hypothetical protein
VTAGEQLARAEREAQEKAEHEVAVAARAAMQLPGGQGPDSESQADADGTVRLARSLIRANMARAKRSHTMSGTHCAAPPRSARVQCRSFGVVHSEAGVLA